MGDLEGIVTMLSLTWRQVVPMYMNLISKYYNPQPIPKEKFDTVERCHTEVFRIWEKTYWAERAYSGKLHVAHVDNHVDNHRPGSTGQQPTINTESVLFLKAVQ